MTMSTKNTPGLVVGGGRQERNIQVRILVPSFCVLGQTYMAGETAYVTRDEYNQFGHPQLGGRRQFVEVNETTPAAEGANLASEADRTGRSEDSAHAAPKRRGRPKKNVD